MVIFGGGVYGGMGGGKKGEMREVSSELIRIGTNSQVFTLIKTRPRRSQ